MASTKARSRIDKKKLSNPKARTRLSQAKLRPTLHKKEKTSNHKNKKENPSLNILKEKLKIKEHLQYSVALILALVSFYLLYLICKNFYPSQIQNFLINNSYLGFFIPFFMGSFFLFSFILLNKKYSLLISFFISISLYFKFLAVKLNLFSIMTIIFLTGLLASLLFLNISRNKE
jgi:hypothetical protein